MPSGQVIWFDAGTGEARLVGRQGREYPAAVSEIEPAARASGARVTFDVARSGGTARAVNVRLRVGTRVASTQRDFGNLAGAKRPDTAGRAGLGRRRPDLDLGREDPPSEVARRWVEALVGEDLPAAEQLYAPDAVIHAGARTSAGRASIARYLEGTALVGARHWNVEIREVGAGVRVRWRPSTEDGARVPASDRTAHTTLRIVHGQIAEQWG